jgi:hypothetical protein
MVKLLILVNKNCDRLNRKLDVTDNTEEQIDAIISKYDKNRWLIIKKYE